MRTASNFIQINGIQIHYERTGGNKPPFLLCHGITDNGRCMLRLTEHLFSRFDVILVDACGHGFSDKPQNGYTADHHADDLYGLIQALGLSNPYLYGHSMGARTVSRLAAKFLTLPKAVILEDPVYLLPMTEEEIIARRQWIKQMATEIRRWKTLSETELRQMAEDSQHRVWTEAEKIEWEKSKQQVSAYVLGMGETMKTILVDCPRIASPVLILKADADEETRQKNEAAAAALTNGKLVHIKDAGHNVRRDN